MASNRPVWANDWPNVSSHRPSVLILGPMDLLCDHTFILESLTGLQWDYTCIIYWYDLGGCPWGLKSTQRTESASPYGLHTLILWSILVNLVHINLIMILMIVIQVTITSRLINPKLLFFLGLPVVPNVTYMTQFQMYPIIIQKWKITSNNIIVVHL